jgi:hypothetical protein
VSLWLAYSSVFGAIARHGSIWGYVQGSGLWRCVQWGWFKYKSTTKRLLKDISAIALIFRVSGIVWGCGVCVVVRPVVGEWGIGDWSEVRDIAMVESQVGGIAVRSH